MLSLLLTGLWTFSGVDLGKVPASISYVNGAVNHGYALVQTTIYRDVSAGKFEQADIKTESFELDLDSIEEFKAQANGPKIIRAQLDVIGPNKQSSKILNVKLETPTPPTEIESYGAAQVGHKIGDLVGVVGGPKYGKAGAVISGLSDLAELGRVVAENEINKLYENQDFKIVILEIIPTRYYRINMNTNTIEPTDEFDREIEIYNDQLTRYLTAFEQYRKVEYVYTQWHKKLTAFDPSGIKQPIEWEKLRKYNAEEVMPKLLEKNKQENAFAKLYSPYRIAIMASAADPGKSCGSYGKGPWEFFIIYYLGAKQTNQMGVRYCVSNIKKVQELGIEVIGNTIQQVNTVNKQQKFLPGGIRMYVKNNASFAQATGLQEGNYGAQRTEVFNFFSEMVTNPEAGKGISNFLLNYDVADFKRIAKQKGKEKLNKKIEKVLESMDKTVQSAKEHSEQGMASSLGMNLGLDADLDLDLDLDENSGDGSQRRNQRRNDGRSNQRRDGDRRNNQRSASRRAAVSRPSAARTLAGAAASVAVDIGTEFAPLSDKGKKSLRRVGKTVSQAFMAQEDDPELAADAAERSEANQRQVEAVD